MWISCGKAVEKFVEKLSFQKLVLFDCEKVPGFAKNINARVGKFILLSGKMYKGDNGVQFAISTIST